MSNLVVADAGPLHYLILIDCAGILEKLFDKVVIPGAVRDELLRPNTPGKVKAWISTPKTWFEIQFISEVRQIHGLHSGEIEAIQLALKTHATAVLMDDLDGRKAAQRLGLTAVGTLGLLERAAETGLIDLPEVVANLRRTNFFIAPELLDAVLERDRARRQKSRRN